MAVSCLGHSDADVKQAIVEQLDRIPFTQTPFYTFDLAEKLADLLTGRAPGNLDRVYCACGRSEATEIALKMARPPLVEKGQPEHGHMRIRRQSYHGNTLGAPAARENQWRRTEIEPQLFETHHIAPCCEYRDKSTHETSEEYGKRVARTWQKIVELGPETVMGFTAETVVGAAAEALPPVPGYFNRIREICDR